MASVVQLYKQANPDALRRELLMRKLLAALGVGAGGLGLGMAARGLMEFGDIAKGWDQPPEQQPQGTAGQMGLSRKERKRPPLGYTPTPLTISLPELRKQAEALPLRAAAAVAAQLGEAKQASLEPVSWWEYPVGVTAGVGGLVGGWKWVDKAIQKRRKRLEMQQLQDAKDEYSAALRDQYRGLLQKRSELDEVFEKIGNRWTEALLGAGALGMGMVGLAGGYGGWRLADARSYKKRLARALEMRKRMLAQQPPPLYATPESMVASQLPEDGDETDEE
jgi:hypothetical protein